MKVINVNDLMQQQYSYKLIEEEGENFHPDFKPQLTPAEMLELGVFGGKYLNDCRAEFPSHWFTNAKLSPDKKDISKTIPGTVYLLRINRQAHHSCYYFGRIDLQGGKLWPGCHAL